MKKIISTQLLRNLIKIQLLENYKKNILLEEPQVWPPKNNDSNSEEIVTPNKDASQPIIDLLTNTNQNQNQENKTQQDNKYNDRYNYNPDDLKIKLNYDLNSQQSYINLLNNEIFSTNSTIFQKLKETPLSTFSNSATGISLTRDDRTAYATAFKLDNPNKDKLISHIAQNIEKLFQNKIIPKNYTLIFPVNYIKQIMIDAISNEGNKIQNITNNFINNNFKYILNDSNQTLSKENFNQLTSYNNPTPTVVSKRKVKKGPDPDPDPRVTVTQQEELTDVQKFEKLEKSRNLYFAFNQLKLVDKLKINGDFLNLDLSSFNTNQQKILNQINVIQKITKGGIKINPQPACTKDSVNIDNGFLTNIDQIKATILECMRGKNVLKIGGFVFNFNA